jgi:hypothetical protein
MKVNEAIEILKTMPQEAQIVVAQNGGGMETCHSIHTAEVNELGIRDVKLTVVVVDVD